MDGKKGYYPLESVCEDALSIISSIYKEIHESTLA
jgi:hypothetical protein